MHAHIRAHSCTHHTRFLIQSHTIPIRKRPLLLLTDHDQLTLLTVPHSSPLPASIYPPVHTPLSPPLSPLPHIYRSHICLQVVFFIAYIFWVFAATSHLRGSPQLKAASWTNIALLNFLDPRACTVAFSPQAQATVGLCQTVVVNHVNANGGAHVCNDASDAFRVAITGPGDCTVEPIVETTGPSTRTVSFTTITSGGYSVDVTLGGWCVGKGPLNITIAPGNVDITRCRVVNGTALTTAGERLPLHAQICDQYFNAVNVEANAVQVWPWL